MKLPALAVTIALVSPPAYAESLVIGCPLIKQYSDSQVNMLLNEARSVIGDQEVGRIYSRYIHLKGACQTNDNASSVVTVSANLRSWLAQNGVDIKKIGKL